MQNISHTSVLKYAQTVLRLIQSIMKYTAFTPRKKGRNISVTHVDFPGN